MASFYYEVHKNGELVMYDRATAVREFLGIGSKDFHNHFRYGKSFDMRGYTVTRTNKEVQYHHNPKAKHKAVERPKEYYQRLLEHLLKYGNTICMVEPTEYIERFLTEEKIMVKATPKFDEKMKKDKKYHRSGKPHWLLEIA